MPRILIAVLSGMMLASAVLAQDTQPTAQPAGANPQMPSQAAPAGSQASQTPKIAPGSVIPVQLTKTIDAKKAKTGDEVVAKVTQDMKTASGEVLVPKDTKVVGHVTEAQARSKEQKQSELGIAFDHAVTKSGDMQLPMSIQAIIAPATNNAGDSGSYDPTGPATGGATATSPMGGRSPMSGSPQPQPQAPPTGENAPSGGNARPPITGNTQGVIGMTDMKLEANAQNAAQGSILSSEKSNVKLESGTLMLLRVSQ